MQEITKPILILLLSSFIWNAGCVSSNAEIKTSANLNQNKQKVDSAQKARISNALEEKIELHLSTKETTCVKSQSCKVFLDIKNVSNEDVEVGGLGFTLRPYSTNSKTDYSRHIDSPVHFSTLENLQPNQASSFIIKANQHIEKEIDVENIKWLKSISSSFEYNDLWKYVTEGKYQMSVGMKLLSNSANSATKKEKIGNIEVEVKDNYRAESNWLTLDFKKK